MTVKIQKKMENNIIKCEICGKEMLKKKINKEIEYDGNKIEFKDIEAYVCDECNNVILESKEVKILEKFTSNEKEMELLTEVGINPYTINEYKDLYPFSDIVPVSAVTHDNTDRLIKVIKKYLTDEVKYYDDDMITSNTMSFMVGEIVREKLLNDTIEEVPHSIACNCIGYHEKKDVVNILVDIIVDRDSIKKIVIGKGGSRLKKVGIEAREEIERLVGKKVYIELYVKTIKNWKDKEKYLLELGYLNNE